MVEVGRGGVGVDAGAVRWVWEGLGEVGRGDV